MTDQTDDGRPSREELEDRVEQLEQTVSEMLPSRRDALKLGGTALAAGGLGSALTGSASAGSASVGTVGTSSDPVDIEAEDINPSGTRDIELGANFAAGGNDINNLGSLDTETIGTERHYAGAFAGSDPDARLDNALVEASDNDTVYLENADYNAGRTVVDTFKIVGTRATATGSNITGTWTISSGGRVNIFDVNLGGTIDVDGDNFELHRSQLSATGGNVTVSGSNCILTALRDINVTFESGSSGCIVDSSTGVSVTDNGTNNVIGDIA